MLVEGLLLDLGRRRAHLLPLWPVGDERMLGLGHLALVGNVKQEPSVTSHKSTMASSHLSSSFGPMQ